MLIVMKRKNIVREAVYLVVLLVLLSSVIFFIETRHPATSFDTAGSITYYVDNGNQGANDSNAGDAAHPFKTIQKAASVAQAGDTVIVAAGAYDERITPARSGSSGSFITFQANGNAKVRGFTLSNREYIKVIGFEITYLGFTSEKYPPAAVFLENSHNIHIISNTIHDTNSTVCVRLRSEDKKTSNFNVISGNTIYRCSSLSTGAPGDGITVYGNSNLIEGNDISHLGDDFLRVTGGNYNVFRNNILHDNSWEDWNSTSHIDGLQNWCSTGDIPTKYTLVENNQFYNAPSLHTHFIIYQDMGSCGSSDFLVRFNKVHNLGTYIQINDDEVDGVRLYHNSFSDTSVAYSTKPQYPVDFRSGSTGGKVVNNIFHNTMRDGGTGYNVDPSSLSGFFASGNIIYNTGYNGSWGAPVNSETYVRLNQNPLFADSQSLTLQSSSPAIDAGRPLTSVSPSDSGSGTTLYVNESGYFQNGWAGTSADWIAVGNSGNVAQIASIDYSSNVITLTGAISRNVGDSVWLFKNSKGEQVLYGNSSDIGAYEYPSSMPLPPPPIVNDTASNATNSTNSTNSTNTNDIGSSSGSGTSGGGGGGGGGSGGGGPTSVSSNDTGKQGKTKNADSTTSVNSSESLVKGKSGKISSNTSKSILSNGDSPLSLTALVVILAVLIFFVGYRIWKISRIERSSSSSSDNAPQK